MGDDGKKIEEKAEERRDLTLTVTIKVGGGIEVTGPGNGQLYDEPLCFWLLEKAKDTIKLKNMRTMQTGLVLPKKQPFYRNIFH